MRNHIMRFFWVFIGIIAAVVVISVVLQAVFVPKYYPSGVSYPYYGMMGYGWGVGPFWGIGMLMMLIPLALLILFILWIVDIARDHNAPTRFGDQERNPLDILNERYARGEITHEEYTRMKDEITRK